MPSLAECEMCQNGLSDYTEQVDGSDVHLCSSCYSMLEESGRLETEVAA